MGESEAMNGVATPESAERAAQRARNRALAAAMERGEGPQIQVAPVDEPLPDVSLPQPPPPVVAEDPVKAPELRVPTVDYRWKFTLAELLFLYDAGRKALPKDDHERWRDTFALAASEGGVLAGTDASGLKSIATYWKTKNPHVDPAKGYPEYHPAGNYVYVAWFWSLSGEDGAKDLQRHIALTVPGAEFVAWHDCRAKVRKGKRGELHVLQLPVTSGEPDGQ